MKTLTKALTRFEVKAVNEEQRTFRGLAATWEEDLGGDIIERGAFADSLKEWKAGASIIPLIDQHNYGSVRAVVGKMTDAEETKSGLEAEFEIIDGPDGDEVLRRIKGGYVDGLSIGYQAVRWEIEETDDKNRGMWGSVRHLKEVKLYEVSVVIWPMNPNATIDAATVKTMLDRVDPAQLTDDERRQYRALASKIGTLLRPQQPNPDEKSADSANAETEKNEPEASPSEEAVTPKASEPAEPVYLYAGALQQRILGVKTHAARMGGS